MEQLKKLQDDIQAGMDAHLPTSGSYKYYAKQLATLQNGIQTLLSEAAIDTTELMLHSLFYEAEALRNDKGVDHSSRLAEIEKEAAAARAELLERKPRPTRRLYPNLSPLNT